MKVNNQPYRTIWEKPNHSDIIQIIDQRHLPHEFVIEDISSVAEMAAAIREMHLRGAPLIGAAAAYGMYLAAIQAPENVGTDYYIKMADTLRKTRPTAVNLSWALDQQLQEIEKWDSYESRKEAALQMARNITDSSVEKCFQIGLHGVKVIEEVSRSKQGATVNILTHCNAGWLACVDHGTATAPIYAAHQKGIDIHVWVDETRPRNQGARLTAWELGQEGVAHTVITDNLGGHLMQHGMVDMVLVGSDRTTRCGDVANKIGTYLKALAAKDNEVPFYVALPSSTIDWSIKNGLNEIPIEERHSDEVKYITGLADTGLKNVLLTPPESPALNYGFDVTPARLVSAIITEKGVCKANETSIIRLFSDK